MTTMETDGAMVSTKKTTTTATTLTPPYTFGRQIYDGKDNDCDGAIDENTLGNDDDGDTVSEAEGDCDDADADSYPELPNS